MTSVGPLMFDVQLHPFDVGSLFPETCPIRNHQIQNKRRTGVIPLQIKATKWFLLKEMAYGGAIQNCRRKEQIFDLWSRDLKKSSLYQERRLQFKRPNINFLGIFLQNLHCPWKRESTLNVVALRSEPHTTSSTHRFVKKLEFFSEILEIQRTQKLPTTPTSEGQISLQFLFKVSFILNQKKLLKTWCRSYLSQQ